MAQEVRFAAPVLPLPPTDYDREVFRQTNNLLRLYFNQIDQFLREVAVTAPKDFYSEVAKGNILGHTSVHKFSSNFDIDVASAPETIWSQGGTYPWSALTSAQILYCKSSNIADASGTMTIQGLDANFAPLTEDVVLDATDPTTTAVATTNAFIRVFRIIYTSSTINAGNITLHTVNGSGTVVAQVPANYGSTLMGVYTIPAGYTGYLMGMSVTASSSDDAQFAVFIREEGQAFRVVHVADVYQNTYKYEFQTPLRFPAKTDVDFRAIAVYSDNTRLSANFDIMLVDDAFLGEPIDLYG